MLKESAVIVMHEQATDSLILTRRSPHLKSHPGETCFPGGGWEPVDKDFWMTALRELQEELGIEPHRLLLIEKLPLETTLGGLIIHPWLAHIAELQPYTINLEEVSEVFRLPMSDVNLITNYKNITFQYKDKQVRTCQFIASNYFVWGATARIMKTMCINNQRSRL